MLILNRHLINFFQQSKCKFKVVNVKFTYTWLKTAIQNSSRIVQNNGQSTYISCFWYYPLRNGFFLELL